MAETLSEMIDDIAWIDRRQASLAAQKAELIDQARHWSELTQLASSTSRSSGWDARTVAHRELVTELASVLRIPERTAESLVADSQTLIHELVSTFVTLFEGKISYAHAKVIIDNANSLPAESRKDFEDAVLPHAEELTRAKLERKARRIRETTHPESIESRVSAAIEKRFVEFEPARDGMAYLTAYLRAVDAMAIHNRLTDMAMHRQGEAEHRTLAQLRADAFTRLLQDGIFPLCDDSTINGIRPTVLISVPVLSLLDRSEEPATLEGYGPIDIGTASQLAAEAPSFIRLLTHPETGTVLSVGRDRYKVPRDLRMFLRHRDETCRFVGCNRAARRSDIDHTHEWQHGGQTAHDNLAHLCPGHHNVKQYTSWQVEQVGGGTLEWTSPVGRKYSTHPNVRMG